MDKTNLRKTLECGTWSVTCNEEFTKQTSRKAKKADTTAADLPGRDPEVKDEKLMQYVYQLAEMVGWQELHRWDWDSCGSWSEIASKPASPVCSARVPMEDTKWAYLACGGGTS